MVKLMMEATAGNRTICRPVGDLDMIGAQLLRRAAAGLVTTDGSVVVDLSGVTFIDSAGLCALVGLARRSTEQGGKVLFVGPRRSIARVLNLTGVDRLLGMTPSQPDALEPVHFGAKRGDRSAGRRSGAP